LYEQLKKRFLHPPKVTVVVTTINRATQLRKTFESFVRLNFNDYEVVVIDDGTDTETPALCAELWPFPLRYFRLDRLRSPEYHNQSVVANYGVRQAYGEIVILQCAECLHVGNVLSDLTNRVTPNNVVLCRADHLNQDGTVNAEKTDYMNIVRERMALFFCGAIYKSWFCKLRGFDERYERFYGADDIDFSDRLRFSGLEFEYLTDSFVQHQWHPIPAMTAEGGKSFRDSQKEAHEFLVKTTADMKAGRIGPIRNLDKEWGQIVNISIVITTYNRPVLLRDTLASINRQGIRNLEIVVVDDGTDNETQEICKQFNATYIKICRPQTAEYRNPARPINIGIRHARGNVILLQNAECVHVDPNTIEKLTRAVTDKNAVFARVTGMKQDGTPDILYCGKEYRRAFFFCGAIKKAWFEKLRGFDEDYTKAGYDDNDFADRLEKEGVQFEFSDIEVHHKWHPRVQTAVSFEPMAALYQQKTAAMAAGRLGTIRNLDREWGALEENSVMAPAAREVSFVDPKGSYWGPKADLPNTTAFDPGGLKSAPTAREVARPSPSLVKPKLALVMATGDLASFRNFQLNAQKFEPHTRKVLVYSGAQEVGNVEGWQIVNGSGNYLDDLNLAIQTAAPDDVLICAPTLRFTANQTSTWLQSVAVKNRRIGVLSPKIQGGAGVQGHPILPAHLTTNPWSVVTSGQSLDPLCLFMLRDVLRYFENGLQDADISRAVKGIGLISAVTPHKTVAHA
jgi:glycosyltransferase involved in cell wall biosynthesis